MLVGGCAAGGGSGGSANQTIGPAPSIISISPRLVQAGSPSFQLTVSGTGFDAASTVMAAGAALPTTFVSATQVTATVPASAIANYGWAPMTVANPASSGGPSSVAALTIYGVIANPAYAIHFDPFGQMLYAAVPGTIRGISVNSVVPINPFTGAVGTPVPVGTLPKLLAESSDGNELYISTAGNLVQYDLIGQRVTQTIPVPSYVGYPVAGIAVMPGTDNTLLLNAVGLDYIFDVAGTVATARPNMGMGNFPAFLDASHVDAYFATSGIFRYAIDANGFTLIDQPNVYGTLGGGFEITGGILYSLGGPIFNVTTTPVAQIATLPLPAFDSQAPPGDPITGLAETADPSLGKDFMVLLDQYGTVAYTYGLVRYDLKSYSAEDSLIFPNGLPGSDSHWTMQRFGQDGLAVLNNRVLSSPDGQIYLFRGPFVAPQELTVQTAASLASSSASSITHGSGNTIITLTGTNFLPGVAVTWNGSYRTTTVVDSGHVTVAIPASDLSAAGSATVVATNPGASASNSLPITVN
jgi:hypothetical protein